MIDDEVEPITLLIKMAGEGDQSAKSRLYTRVESSLRSTAQFLLRSRPNPDLQTTDLINEVYIRLELSDTLKKIPNRRVFFAVLSKAMSNVLIDHYRKRKTAERCLPRSRVPLDEVIDRIEQKLGVEFVDLHEELLRLKAESPRQHMVIFYRFFGGCSIAETAELLGVSSQSVQRDWRFARARLARRLGVHGSNLSIE